MVKYRDRIHSQVKSHFLCSLIKSILNLILGNYKCREDWPSLDYEKAYNLFLDVVLLVIPLLVLGVTYSLITRTLCKGMKTERSLRDHSGKLLKSKASVTESL